MAITNGMTGDLSGIITFDTPFYTIPNSTTRIFSTYITFSVTGNIVWRNRFGDLQYLSGISSGSTVAIAATEILSAGVVSGTPRTSTPALDGQMNWIGSEQVN
jgi:hypothetical protein